MTSVLIHTQQGTQAVQVDNIIRIEASSNYSKLYLKRGYPLTVAKLLHWFEAELKDDFFYRIHKTHIVNKQFIAAVSPDHTMLTLMNGDQIKISRRRKNAIRQLLA